MKRGWMVGIAAVAVSLPQVGFAEQPLKQLPEDAVSFSLAWIALPQTMVEVTTDDGPLAGASWGVIKGTSEVAGRVLKLMDQGPASERRTQILTSRTGVGRGDEGRSPAWLNLREGKSRPVHHEPALLRYTF